ncbi:MAG: alkaline phosphatase [Bacteroidales bacterium]|jgi:alkaline phosphatase|nr:alkaline phosphatase [Bacteroidales bacterium]
MKRIMLKSMVLAALFAVFAGAAGCKEKAEPAPKAKNVIILIGDGMGVAQLYAGMTAAGHKLNIERFPYSGFSKTYSADNYITDSAAGGTAIATGEKTNNGMIGVSPDGTPLSSITETANRAGLASGVVSTSAVTHATPASFVAHNAARGNYEDIAKDFLKGTIDVFIGGGANHFIHRSDSVDLTAELRNKAYDVIYTMDDLKRSTGSKIACLLAPEHMPKASEGRRGMLKDMTLAAIKALNSEPAGFVLMVEGSQIDWGGHENDIRYVADEMVDFDEAIGAALDFAATDGNTLVVVTADHETGGLALTGGNMADSTVVAGFSTEDHSAVMVPVFSCGPGAERFSGIHENTFFHGEFLKLLGLTE